MRPRRPARANAEDRWVRAAAVVGLAAFVVGVYVVIVVVGGALVGRTGSPSVALPVIATADVALGFTRARRLAACAAAPGPGRGAGVPVDALHRRCRAAT